MDLYTIETRAWDNSNHIVAITVMIFYRLKDLLEFTTVTLWHIFNTEILIKSFEIFTPSQYRMWSSNTVNVHPLAVSTCFLKIFLVTKGWPYCEGQFKVHRTISVSLVYTLIWTTTRKLTTTTNNSKCID